MRSNFMNAAFMALNSCLYTFCPEFIRKLYILHYYTFDFHCRRKGENSRMLLSIRSSTRLPFFETISLPKILLKQLPFSRSFSTQITNIVYQLHSSSRSLATESILWRCYGTEGVEGGPSKRNSSTLPREFHPGQFIQG